MRAITRDVEERVVSSAFVGVPWEGVARALARAHDLDGVRLHRLHLLEAERLRELAVAVPDDLEEAVRSAMHGTLLTRALLARVRKVCEGSLLVLKGPEAAAVYPFPWSRPYTDVDILVEDAADADRRLRAAGFRGVGAAMDWDSLHHLQRLAAPDLLATVEIHRRPKWPLATPPPSIDELLAGAVPSATGVDGLLAPSRAHHAVLLAAHAWAERPLGRLGDLVDVAAMREQAPTAADELASRYGLDRIWLATLASIDALLVHDHRTWATTTWARHLPRLRERTVVEAHLERLLEPWASSPPLQVPVGLAQGLARTVLPRRDESWREKLHRARRALRSPRTPVSDHVRLFQDEPGDEP